jgi:hypothetical protein
MMRHYDKSLSDCDGVGSGTPTTHDRAAAAAASRRSRRTWISTSSGKHNGRAAAVRKCRCLAAPLSFDPDACPLLRQLEDLLAFNWHWRAWLWNFESENEIRARSALIAVLLQELSSNNPVPRALAQ